jgi:hypothetical protein
MLLILAACCFDRLGYMQAKMAFDSGTGTSTFDQGMNMVYKSFFIAAISTALSVSALAAPTPAAGKQTLSNVSGKNCTAAPSGQDTRDGVAAPGRDANDFNLDGLNNPCRLVDGSVGNDLSKGGDGSLSSQANVRLSASSQVNQYSDTDVAQVQKRFDAVTLSMANNKSGSQLNVYQSQGLNKINLNTLSSQDKLFGQGLNNKNLGSISPLDDLFDWESHKNTDRQIEAFNGSNGNRPAHIENPGRQNPGGLSGSAPGTAPSVSAVPEPATYATMLAGLACLAIALQRKTVSTR